MYGHFQRKVHKIQPSLTLQLTCPAHLYCPFFFSVSFEDLFFHVISAVISSIIDDITDDQFLFHKLPPESINVILLYGSGSLL